MNDDYLVQLNQIFTDKFNVDCQEFISLCESNEFESLIKASEYYIQIEKLINNDLKTYLYKKISSGLFTFIDNFNSISDNDYSFEIYDKYISQVFELNNFDSLSNIQKNLLRFLVATNYSNKMFGFIENNYSLYKPFLIKLVTKTENYEQYNSFLEKLFFFSFNFNSDIKIELFNSYLESFLHSKDIDDLEKQRLTTDFLNHLFEGNNYNSFLDKIYNEYPDFFSVKNSNFTNFIKKSLSEINNLNIDYSSKKEIIDSVFSKAFSSVIIDDSNSYFLSKMHYYIDINTPSSILSSIDYVEDYINNKLFDIDDEFNSSAISDLVDALLSKYNIAKDKNDEKQIRYYIYIFNKLFSYDSLSSILFDKDKKREYPIELFNSYGSRLSYFTYIKKLFDNNEITIDEKNNMILNFIGKLYNIDLTVDEITYLNNELEYDVSKFIHDDLFLNGQQNYEFINSNSKLIEALVDAYNKKYYYTFLSVIKNKNVSLDEFDFDDNIKDIINNLLLSFNLKYFNDVFDDDFIFDEKYIKEKIINFLNSSIKNNNEINDILLDFNYLDLDHLSNVKYEYILLLEYDKDIRKKLFNILFEANVDLSELEIFKLFCNNVLDEEYNLSSFFRNSELNYINPVFRVFSEMIDRIKNKNEFLNNIDSFFDGNTFTKNFFVYLFDHEFYILINYLNNSSDSEKEFCLSCLNPKQIKVISVYLNMKSVESKDFFLKYLFDFNDDNIRRFDLYDLDKIDVVRVVLNRLEFSNSSELRRINVSIADKILEDDKPYEKLDSLENIYLQNSVPPFIKSFYTFKILFPDFEKSSISINKNSSPILQKCIRSDGNFDYEKFDLILLSDLARITVYSNSKKLKEYINTLKVGVDISNNHLDLSDPVIVNRFFNIIYEFFNLHYDKKIDISNIYSLDTGRVDKDLVINNIINVINISKELGFIGNDRDYSIDFNTNKISFSKDDLGVFEVIVNKIISKYFDCIGINKLDELIGTIESNVKSINEKNRRFSEKPFKLEDGDLIKGIGSYNYSSSGFYNFIIPNILSNGVLCKELLGEDASSDSTSLDTDFSIYDSSDKSLRQSDLFGNVLIIVKDKDKKYNITKRADVSCDKNLDIGSLDNNDKLEAFNTIKKNQYGIRFGIPTSDISAFMVKGKYDNRLGLEIAKSGIYIPVVDDNFNYLFTWDDFCKYRCEMSGLSYYDNGDNYKLSNNLTIDSYISNLSSGINNTLNNNLKIRNKIEEVISSVLSKYGIKLKNYLDGDISFGTAELLDTGSTSRGTCIPGDTDFDFILRFDNSVYKSGLYEKINKEILDRLRVTKQADYSNLNDIRKACVQVLVDGKICDVEMDISSISKTDKVDYSTEKCLSDRLSSIKRLYPEQYNDVLANIIAAKILLKNASVYKKKKNKDGVFENGLGGVGVENWILQNGGSLYDACSSFIDVSNRCKNDLSLFREKYRIIDFGKNHNVGNNINGKNYFHDNFCNNLTEESYSKMLSICIDYKNYIDDSKSRDLSFIDFDELNISQNEVNIFNK